MNYTKHHKNIASFRLLYFALALCGIFIATLANSPAPARAALKSPDPVYDGHVDRGDCSFIGGYALDENTPNVPINVDIYDGPYLLATIPANQFRRDLSDAGMDPYHGFLFSVPTSVKNGKIHTIYVRFGGTPIDVPDSPRFIACKASLFPTATPVTTASGQGLTWEQGVEFSSSMDGIIRQVKFWRAAEESPGGHVAHIWNASSGALLASADFTNETVEPGWQYATVNLPITAGVRYRVTYNIKNVVAKTFNVFNNGPITKGPLTGWLSYYGTPAGQFPTSASTSNLFADVVFNAPQ
jgi:hypothetical protein